MGLPAENVEGYRSSSVMTHVDNYRRMMLVHGLIDENVHFRHTARLINKLVEARKCYDLMLFPCERHSPHGLDNRVYLEDGILFFLLHLGDADDDNSNKRKQWGTQSRYGRCKLGWFLSLAGNRFCCL